jgi:hypothetical protein
MDGWLKLLLFTLAGCVVATAADNLVESTQASKDVALDTNPASPFWHAARPVYMNKDTHGNVVPGYRTEVRRRWTRNNLYVLFVCPYEELYLKAGSNTVQETNQLWNWDVAEIFIGSDFQQIKRYKEFELSPQGEWIDLDIDLNKPHHEDGWAWNSGFKVSARIDPAAHVWYGAMRIPFASIEGHPPQAGNTLRVNLFRSQGPPANRHEITWQPPLSESFHVPERFGSLKLVAEPK